MGRRLPDTLSDPLHALAAQFVKARLHAAAMTNYPGEAPTDLDAAYAVQDAAIALWPDEIAGWKVGLIREDLRAQFQAERLAGPIFRSQVFGATGEVELPMIGGGFGAVEAELVLVVERTPPADKLEWSAEEASHFAAAMHVGVEFAGSPFRGINDFGPAVTASDFGNNAGLVLGAEIQHWRAQPVEALAAETFVDGVSVGYGSGANVPGGPLAAFAFILAHCAKRGLALKPGDLISTGAITGVHVVEAGQSARVDFGPWGEIRCRTVDARSAKPRAASA